MSSVGRNMETPLPGMTTQDFTVNKPPVKFTVLSDDTTTEQHVKEKKSKGVRGFFKRTWKAVKRPFSRSRHETKVEAIVPDTSVPCASGLQRKADREQISSQLYSVSGPCQPPTTALPPKRSRSDDDLEVISITNSDWSVCINVQQDSELPADASAEDIERVRLQDNEENKAEQEQHAKGEKRKDGSGIFRRMSKAVKRPFRRHCRKTKTKQEHVKKEKNKGNCGFFKRTREAVKHLRWRLRTRVSLFFIPHRRRWRKHMTQHRRNRLCPHHRCCPHPHSCPLRRENIVLGVREQIMSTVPSVSGPPNYPENFRTEPSVEERQRPIRRPRRKTRVTHKTQEQHGKENKKGICGFFERTWKAVKRPFHRCETRVEPIVPDKPAPCASGLQQTAEREQISSERTSVSVPNEEKKPQEQQAKEKSKRIPLFVSPMFQPSEEMFSSLYNKEYVTLGDERLGEVSLATRKSDGQKVAVKQVLSSCWSASTYTIAGYMDNVMTEVAMMSLLKQPPISPYVIQMLEWFHEPVYTYIVMEDPGSCTVLKKIIELHPLNEKIARVIMRQAVQAAQHCIAHGVFHYNISACNILVNTSTLDIKLIDFGYSMPYTGRKYHRPPGQTVPNEYDYRAVEANVGQLGWLLNDMIYGPFNPHGSFLPKNIFMSNECRSLIDWCTHHVDLSKRPTLEQILQHRWFRQK